MLHQSLQSSQTLGQFFEQLLYADFAYHSSTYVLGLVS